MMINWTAYMFFVTIYGAIGVLIMYLLFKDHVK